MGPFIRIALRYGAGALVAWGVVSAATADQIVHDPDIQALLMAMAHEVGIWAGAVIGIATEYAYKLAKRWGWAT